MRNFWLFFVCLLVFAAFGGLQPLYCFAFNKQVTLTFYTTQPFFNAEKNGNTFMVKCNLDNAKQTYLSLDKNLLKGQSMCFFGSKEDIKNYILRYNIKVVSREDIGSIYVVNGYNSKFGKGVLCGTNYVNIQLAYNMGVVTIGCPMILGSF